MKRIIFLDIDGVLNHQLYYEEKRQCERVKEEGYDLGNIDGNKVDLLYDLCEDLDIDIVISSSWRLGKDVEYFKELLSQKGFNPNRVIDITPDFYIKDYGSIPRGVEIDVWLQKNSLKYKKSSEFQYVILDDDSDMLLNQRNNYFQVDGYCGITPNLCYRVRRFFEGY